MKTHVTLTEAATLTGRSKRTIRRWLSDPRNRIRVIRDDGRRLIDSGDLLRVEAEKTAYTEHPTFNERTAS